MKRFTYWPQLFLGVTFNYGLILGWSSINNEISLIPVIFYFGAIFWTLGYDTIYGYQDIKDDEIIGLKSTSIKFKSNPYMFLNLCYLIFAVSLLVVGYLMKLSNLYFLFCIVIIFQMFYFQVYKLNYKNPSNCLQTFKSNNLLGLLIFLNFLIGQI
jgi:4-hydroxybenzoate polyprenyltransferase